ncbi:PREDICTED: patatin-like protein 3 isoform X2 [Ipomoea nil]|uniref:patatin-like protein 3 isoform X2 n=1 Tax=Ipomoea nil TaxID=35883 RepID=UPI000901C3E0|nr:PREDICTED: patatin-like protein 3 isoform X2 [Ipomoea nil]
MAAVSTVSMLDSTMGVDKLTYEIFSVLENKFLFGCDDPKRSPVAGKERVKVRILSIDAGGSTDGVLAAKSLAHLEAILRRKSGNFSAHIADFFDVAAGSGAGGVLAALLFTRRKDGGGPMFTAEEALKFIVENGRKFSLSSPTGVFRRVFRPSKVFKKAFGCSTLKETAKAVLIPCYDLSTGAPFLFSRADAVEMEGCDFKLAEVCGATVADRAVEMKSVDRKTRISAVGGGVAMNNPTAAAITHVLNNKHEFPLCNGVEDLLVVSLGNGESDSGTGNFMSSPAAFVSIAGDGAADMVDQALSMAFGQASSKSNYIRIQGHGIFGKRHQILDGRKTRSAASDIADEMLRQRNVESILFQGRKVAGITNLQKLEGVAGELIKEQERRKTSVLPPVVLLKHSHSPRTSSSTTLSSISSSS